MASKTNTKPASKASAKSKAAAITNNDDLNIKVDTVKTEVKIEVKPEVKPAVKQESKKESKQESNQDNKPLSSTNFNPSNVNFGNIYTDQYDNRSIKTTYNNKDFYMVARGCRINVFKLQDNGKYNLYVNVTDDDFINAIKSYDDSLIKYGSDNSKLFFDDEMSEEDCRELFKPKTLSLHEKYGYSISCNLKKKDFICKSKTDSITDVSDLTVALQKGTIVDVCFDFGKIKLGLNKYSVGVEIKQVNIISVGAASAYKSNAIKLEDFNLNKLKINEIETLEKGNKKTQMLYGEDDNKKPLKFLFENIEGRIFGNKQPNDEKTSYSLNIKLNPEQHKKFDEINEETLKQTIQELCKGMDANKAALKAKVVKKEFKSIVTYSKADQDKIKKGEKPTYPPSIWIKIYHSDEKDTDGNEKGFCGKIVNAEGNKPINNSDELVAIKNLNIKSLEIYNKHIWIGAKGISVNFTLNKCEISMDVAPSYDMDFIDDGYSNNKPIVKEAVKEIAKAVVKEEDDESTEEEAENSSEEENSDSD